LGVAFHFQRGNYGREFARPVSILPEGPAAFTYVAEAAPTMVLRRG